VSNILTLIGLVCFGAFLFAIFFIFNFWIHAQRLKHMIAKAYGAREALQVDMEGTSLAELEQTDAGRQILSLALAENSVLLDTLIVPYIRRPTILVIWEGFAEITKLFLKITLTYLWGSFMILNVVIRVLLLPFSFLYSQARKAIGLAEHKN